MHVFIDFWKLEIENSLLHVFSFLYKLSFENNFCFLSILSCQTSFLVSKIENCFWKQKIRGKTVTKHTLNRLGLKLLDSFHFETLVAFDFALEGPLKESAQQELFSTLFSQRNFHPCSFWLKKFNSLYSFTH